MRRSFVRFRADPSCNPQRYNIVISWLMLTRGFALTILSGWPSFLSFGTAGCCFLGWVFFFGGRGGLHGCGCWLLWETDWLWRLVCGYGWLLDIWIYVLCRFIGCLGVRLCRKDGRMSLHADICTTRVKHHVPRLFMLSWTHVIQDLKNI